VLGTMLTIKQETQGEMVGDLGNRADTVALVPGSQRDQPEVARRGGSATLQAAAAAEGIASGKHFTTTSAIASVRQLTGVSARRFRDWLPVLSVHFAGLRVCDVSRKTPGPTPPATERRAGSQ